MHDLTTDDMLSTITKLMKEPVEISHKGKTWMVNVANYGAHGQTLYDATRNLFVYLCHIQGAH